MAELKLRADSSETPLIINQLRGLGGAEAPRGLKSALRAVSMHAGSLNGDARAIRGGSAEVRPYVLVALGGVSSIQALSLSTGERARWIARPEAEALSPIWIQSGLPIFEILEVPKNAEESIEQLGTKYKFWFHHPTLGRCLCKLGRPNTGEDWSEKVAAEFCRSYRVAACQIRVGYVRWSALCRFTQVCAAHLCAYSRQRTARRNQ